MPSAHLRPTPPADPAQPSAPVRTTGGTRCGRDNRHPAIGAALPAAVLALLMSAAVIGCGGGEDPGLPAAKTDSGPPVPDPAWDVAAKPRGWKYVVIHHSATKVGNYARFDNDHRDARGWDGCGYHFVIGNGTGSGDGEVEVGFRWLQQREGAHAGKDFRDYNQHGVGVCLVGDFTHTRPTAAQMKSLARLVRWLEWKHAIPRSGVLGHGKIRVGTGPERGSECPGKLFPWDELMATLDGRPAPTPSTPPTKDSLAARR